MKRIILLSLLIAGITGAAVFAAGGQEQTFDDNSRPGTPWDGEVLTLTGELKLTDAYHPELNVDGEVYGLMYPPFLDDGIDVSDGEKITIEGFIMPGPRWADDDVDKYVRVTKAIIDGQEYEADLYGGRWDEGYGPCCADDDFGGYRGRSGGMRGGMSGRGRGRT